MIAMVNVEHDLHMAEGEGEWSYSKNSRRQVIVILPFSTMKLFLYVVSLFVILHVLVLSL